MAKPIVLITRTKTKNQGNAALSRAWQGLLGDIWPERPIVTVERVPDFLKRFSARQFAMASDPISAFDRAAAIIAASATAAATPYLADPIVFDDSPPQPRRLSNLRKHLQIRQKLAKFGAYDRARAPRQALIGSAAAVIMNAAGEFLPRLTDTPIQYLIDLRAAQLAGVPTGFVNTSFEVTDPTVRRIAVHVLDRAQAVIFRDRASLANYRVAGGQGPATVVADAAMLHSHLHTAAAPTGRVALAFNGPATEAAGLIPAWIDLAQRLRARGLNPIFVSNEWFNDAPLWRDHLTAHGLSAAGEGLDVDDYVGFLNSFDCVVSGRLHTAVLSVIAGAPAVPVETGTFKITGLFDQIGFDRPLTVTSNWSAAAADHVSDIVRRKADVVISQQRLLARARDDVTDALTARLHDAFPTIGSPRRAIWPHPKNLPKVMASSA